MRIQFFLGYMMIALLCTWSGMTGNLEFLIYAFAVFGVLALINWTDSVFRFKDGPLWAFIGWIVLHILGGLFFIGDTVLYSQMLIPIVGEPYSVLKYDQVVHAYCYFVIALLMWSVVGRIARFEAAHSILVVVTVLAATGIGGLNEIIEFVATVLVPETNVGGYENTAIDIVANLVGAMLAIPFFKKLKR